MEWNYDFEKIPLNIPVKLLSSDDCFLLPQMEYVGTVENNGSNLVRGKCIIGDHEYFYRSAIIAWKFLE